jgi:hypothetical protein
MMAFAQPAFASSPGPVLQRKPAAALAPHAGLASVRPVLNSPGHALDASTRGFMETRFGHDFSRVRVHSDGAAAESAAAVNSLAYTVGNHVVFGAGMYTPGSQDGRALLAHELSHVLQQPAGTPSGPLAIGEAGDSFEREAGRMADAVMSPGREPRAPAMRSQPGVIRRQEPRPPTAGEVKADARLRRLASWPGDALTEWKKLNDAERSFITIAMTGRYGAEFTLDFLKYASGEKKPNISTSITNAPQDQPKELAKRGYKHAVDNIWVHPSGHVVFSLSPAQKGEPQPPEPKKDEPITEDEDKKREKCQATCEEVEDEDECYACCEKKIPEDDKKCRTQCKVVCATKL